MNRVGLGLAVGAGYVLGRTKKMKLAFAVGTLVAGKRMQLSPRALADLVSRQLQNNPQFKEVGDQLREDLRGVGKAASGAMVERRLGALADRLHGRTAEVREQLAGVGERVPDAGLGGEDAKEPEDPEEPEYAEDWEDAEEPEDYEDAEGTWDDEPGEPDSEEADRPEAEERAPAKAAAKKTAQKAAKKAPAKKTTARNAPAKKTPAKKAPAKKAAAKKAAAKKTTTGKRAANKTAAVRDTARGARARLPKGGDER